MHKLQVNESLSLVEESKEECVTPANSVTRNKAQSIFTLRGMSHFCGRLKSLPY